jgi:hypothetical protein
VASSAEGSAIPWWLQTVPFFDHDLVLIAPAPLGATLRSWLANSSFVRHDRAMPEPSRR